MRDRATSFAVGWVLFVVLPTLLCGWLVARGLELHRADAARDAVVALLHDERAVHLAARPAAFVVRRFRTAHPPTALQHRPTHALTARYTPGRPLSATATGDLGVVRELAAFLAGGPPPQPPQLMRWRDVLGWEFDPHLARERPDLAQSVRWGREAAWLIWTQRRPQTSVDRPAPTAAASATVRVMLCRPPTAASLYAEGLRRVRAESSSSLRGHIINRRTGRDLTDGQPVEAELLGRLAALSELRPTTTVGVDRVELIEALPHNLALTLSRPIRSPLTAATPARVQWATALLLIALTIAYPRLHNAAPHRPLVQKLMLVFAYVVVLPLLAIGILGMGALADRRQIVEQAAQQMARETIMGFDEGFRTEEDSFERWCARLINDGDLVRGRFTAFAARAQRWLAGNVVEHIEAWGWDGKPHLDLYRTVADPGTQAINNELARRKIAEAQARSADSLTDPQVMAVWEMLQARELGYVEILRKPGKLHHMRLGTSNFYNYYCVAPWSRDRHTAYVMIERSHRQMVSRYVQRHLVRNRACRLVVRDRTTGRWYPGGVDTRGLDALQNAVMLTGEEQLGMLHHSGQAVQVLGLPGLRLDGFDVLALIPDVLKTEEATWLRDFLVTGTGLALVAGLLCLWILAGSLSVPIADLAIGIAQVRAHVASHRIPIRSDDEFGRLAAAFNRLLETLGELQVAQGVQASFLPREIPAPPGYEIAFRTALVESVGGCYVDFYARPDGRVVMLIGDAAGCGLQAALVMTMAKSLAFTHVAEDADLDTLPMRMHNMLRDIAPRRRTMDLAVAVLDPAAHTMRYTLAGQPAWLVVDAGTQNCLRHGSPTLPLGEPTLDACPTEMAIIAPGATWCSCTGGAAAVANSAGHTLGWRHLEATATEAAPTGADALCGAVLARIDAHRQDRTLSDDVAVVAIRRLPA